VGKTSVASALASLAVEQGQRVLIVELDPVGALAAALETPTLRFQPQSFAPTGWAMAMDTEAALAEYLRLFVKLPVLGRLGPLARTFDFVAQAAPGVREILTIGKLCHEVRQQHYDLVVVDAPASGHVVELLNAPRVVHDLVHMGMVQQQTAWMLAIVEDPVQTGVVLVTTPEELPVNETIEMLGRWRNETQVRVAAVVANRVLPESFGAPEQAVFDALADATRADVVIDRLGAGAPTAVAATQWAVARRRLAATHLARLRQFVAAEPPLVLLPDVPVRAGGRRLVTQLCEHLTFELDVVP
jgi:anion-transporting  ArsA/GET3 family ATPase